MQYVSTTLLAKKVVGSNQIVFVMWGADFPKFDMALGGFPKVETHWNR